MNVEEYRDVVHEDIALAAKANASEPEEEFLLYATGILVNGEEFEDFITRVHDYMVHGNIWEEVKEIKDNETVDKENYKLIIKSKKI